MMRFINVCVIVALVLAAADVYKIKFEAARQVERLAKLRIEIAREHDSIAGRTRRDNRRARGGTPCARGGTRDCESACGAPYRNDA